MRQRHDDLHETGLRGALAPTTCLTTLVAGLLLAAPAFADENERVDVAVDGGVPDSPGNLPAITPDGASSRSNRVRRISSTRASSAISATSTSAMTELVSVDNDGNRSGNNSNSASISADGRFIAFEDNLLSTGTAVCVWVHDRQTGETKQLDGDGTVCGWASGDPMTTPDGRFVSFHVISGQHTPVAFEVAR